MTYLTIFFVKTKIFEELQTINNSSYPTQASIVKSHRTNPQPKS